MMLIDVEIAGFTNDRRIALLRGVTDTRLLKSNNLALRSYAATTKLSKLQGSAELAHASLTMTLSSHVTTI